MIMARQLLKIHGMLCVFLQIICSKVVVDIFKVLGWFLTILKDLPAFF